MIFKKILRKLKSTLKKITKKLYIFKKNLKLYFFNTYFKKIGVNIGAGRDWTYYRFDGIDRLDGERLDENSVFPYEDSFLKYVYSSHFIEHVNDEVVKNFMDESYRVLKKGGIIRILTPDFEKLQKILVQNDLNFYKHLGFSGRKEWQKFGVESNIENFTLHFFANYQNTEYEISEDINFNSEDFYRGPPKIDSSIVREKAKSLSTLDFGEWATSQIPKKYFNYNGHINTFTYSKIEKMLLKSGFEMIEKSSIGNSKCKQFNVFDFSPPREEISLYVEAIKR